MCILVDAKRSRYALALARIALGRLNGWVQHRSASRSSFRPVVTTMLCPAIACEYRRPSSFRFCRCFVEQPTSSHSSICLPRNDLNTPPSSPISAMHLHTTRKTEKRKMSDSFRPDSRGGQETAGFGVRAHWAGFGVRAHLLRIELDHGFSEATLRPEPGILKHNRFQRDVQLTAAALSSYQVRRGRQHADQDHVRRAGGC